MVDYLTFMLINTAAALFTISWFFWKGPARLDAKTFAPPFLTLGGLALITGLHMATTWPLTQFGQNNVRFANPAFGESSALLGLLMIAAGIALAKQWDLRKLAVMSLIFGLAAAVYGLRIFHLNLTQGPAMTAAGFLAAGLAGILASAALCHPSKLAISRTISVLTFLSAAIWTMTGLVAIWMHLKTLSGIIVAP